MPEILVVTGDYGWVVAFDFSNTASITCKGGLLFRLRTREFM
jgi:hypothetical protein